jgi:ABC-type phosphate/phosphonate transport system ATPase subunit
MRAEIAKAVLQPQKLIVFDEFTSVVDREIAKVSSMAIAKAIGRSDKQFIAVTCHCDVLDYSMEPLDQVERFIEANVQLGYTTKEEFIQDTIR